MALCLAAMLFSCLCSLVLKKQEMALLLALFSFAFIFSYNKEMEVYFYVMTAFCGFLSVVGNNEKNKVLFFLLFWFAAYYCLMIVFGPYPKSIWGWFFRTISLAFLFLWTILIKWDRKNILFIVVSYGSYLLAWGFLEKLISNPQRIGGPMAMPTEYAVVISILWSIWFVDSCKRRQNLLILIIPTSLVLLAILFSGARTGLIGLGIGALFGIHSYAFTNLTVSQTSMISKSIKFFIILLFVSFIFSIVWNTFIKDFLVARTMDSMLHGKIDSSNMGRIVMWLSAYDTFSNNKIWGAGPDTFSGSYSIFIKTFPDIRTLPKSPPHAHNEILQILSELGLVGFIHLSVIASFCIFSIINFMRKNRRETICYGIIAGFSIFFVTMFVNGTPSFGIIPWLMGIMASFYFSYPKQLLEK
jgi:O-antigen ligase